MSPHRGLDAVAAPARLSRHRQGAADAMRVFTSAIGPAVVLAMVLAACTDNLAQSCPPLAHPPILTAAAADNPCQARAGETVDLLRLRVVKTYQRSQPPAPGMPTRFPLRCGDAGFGRPIR